MKGIKAKDTFLRNGETERILEGGGGVGLQTKAVRNTVLNCCNMARHISYIDHPRIPNAHRCF